MRLVVQRVTAAQVRVDSGVVASVGVGLVVLVGVARDDTAETADWAAAKVAGLRVFSGSDGKMRLSVRQVQGSVLAVSQFTLLGTVRRGQRPDFARAAGAGEARLVYDRFVQTLGEAGIAVQTGVFGAHMQLSLVNDGPVTIIIDTDEVMPSGIRAISDAERHP